MNLVGLYFFETNIRFLKDDPVVQLEYIYFILSLQNTCFTISRDIENQCSQQIFLIGV